MPRRSSMKVFKKRSRQSGFGILETLIGLFVFALLVVVAGKAFNSIRSNHKEAAQLKALTDAVATTAEKLATMSIGGLTDPAAGYQAWSPPQDAGLGDYVYRYRIVPKPLISGASDTTIVGLEVETGTVNKGVFTASRSFATLIAPHLISKDGLGKSSTEKERDSEASFYASLRQMLASVSKEVVGSNQIQLNSFNCYDPGECCGFMKEFFQDPNIVPQDGLKEKCLYRCAMAGGIKMDKWQNSCGTNFCAIAPWKNSNDCCEAINSGNCPQGSVCASVCFDCVHEDGSTCGPPVCEDAFFNDLFNCAKGTMCNGMPIPDGEIPGWGNVKSICKMAACQALENDCGEWTINNCCRYYWDVLARGGQPNERDQICGQMTKQSDCCELDFHRGFYEFTCTTTGVLEKVTYDRDGQTYCPSDVFSASQNNLCAIYKGCSGSYGGTVRNGGNSCGSWPFGKMSDAGADPTPPPPQSGNSNGSSHSGGNSSSGTKNQPAVLKPPGITDRIPTNRKGSPSFGGGGRE
jgi:type II secretory pathway pseudopilin PulG